MKPKSKKKQLSPHKNICMDNVYTMANTITGTPCENYITLNKGLGNTFW